MLGAGRLHELAHLLAELGQALLGLGGPRELLGREHGADLERGLRAVLRELVAELADAPELRLQVGGLQRPGRQQLGAQLLLGLAELLDERPRGRRGARTGSRAPSPAAPASAWRRGSSATARRPCGPWARACLRAARRDRAGETGRGPPSRSRRSGAWRRGSSGSSAGSSWFSSGERLVELLRHVLEACSRILRRRARRRRAAGSPLTENSAAETSARIAATSCGCMVGGTGVTARHTATSTQISSAAATAASPTAAGIQRRRRAGAGRVRGSGVSRSTPVIRASSPRRRRWRAAHAAQPARCARSATEASSASTRSSASSERQAAHRASSRLRRSARTARKRWRFTLPGAQPEGRRHRERGLLLDVAEREDLLLAPRQRAKGGPDPPPGVLADRDVAGRQASAATRGTSSRRTPRRRKRIQPPARRRSRQPLTATRVSQAPQLAGTRPSRSASCAFRKTSCTTSSASCGSPRRRRHRRCSRP